MAETLGSLCDKLSIVNLKLWFTQEEVNQAALYKRDLPGATARRLVELNLQRNKLATEIDQTLARAVESGTVDVDPRHKI